MKRLEQGGRDLPLPNMTNKNNNRNKTNSRKTNFDPNLVNIKDYNSIQLSDKRTLHKKKKTDNEMHDSDDLNSSEDEQFKMDAEETTTEEMNSNKIETKKAMSELYKPTDKQPFHVIASSKQDFIDCFDLGMKIKQSNIEKIDSIQKISKNKARVTLNDWKNADKLIKLNSYDIMKNYDFIIPSAYVHSEGIIRDIPVYLSNEEIRKNVRSSAVITDVYRLNYWNFATKQSLPSNTVKITFRAAKVPEEI